MVSLLSKFPELQGHSHTNFMSVHMHIEVAFIILLYPVQYTTGICSLHTYPCLFLLLYHHLKLTSGHTCKISYCTAILCVLASILNKQNKSVKTLPIRDCSKHSTFHDATLDVECERKFHHEHQIKTFLSIPN